VSLPADCPSGQDPPEADEKDASGGPCQGGGARGARVPFHRGISGFFLYVNFKRRMEEWLILVFLIMFTTLFVVGLWIKIISRKRSSVGSRRPAISESSMRRHSGTPTDDIPAYSSSYSPKQVAKGRSRYPRRGSADYLWEKRFGGPNGENFDEKGHTQGLRAWIGEQKRKSQKKR